METADLDPRAQRTRRALVEAMAELLEQREPVDIAVTEIVARAGVSRPSFYQHAGDIPALVAQAGLDRLGALFARSNAETAGLTGDERARRTMRTIVDGLAADREFYRRVLRGSHDAAARVTDFVTARLRERFDLGADQRGDDLVTAIAAGATWLLIRWLDDDAPAADRMADRALDVLLTLSAAAERV